MNGAQRAMIPIAVGGLAGLAAVVTVFGVLVAVAAVWAVSLAAMFVVFRFEERWHPSTVATSGPEPVVDLTPVVADADVDSAHGKLTHHDRRRRNQHQRVPARV